MTEDEFAAALLLLPGDVDMQVVKPTERVLDSHGLLIHSQGPTRLLLQIVYNEGGVSAQGSITAQLIIQVCFSKVVAGYPVHIAIAPLPDNKSSSEIYHYETYDNALERIVAEVSSFISWWKEEEICLDGFEGLGDGFDTQAMRLPPKSSYTTGEKHSTRIRQRPPRF